MNELPSRRAVLVYSACVTVTLVGVVVLAFATRSGETTTYAVDELHRVYHSGMDGQTVRVRGRVNFRTHVAYECPLGAALLEDEGGLPPYVSVDVDPGAPRVGATVTVEGTLTGRDRYDPQSTTLRLRRCRLLPETP